MSTHYHSGNPLHTRRETRDMVHVVVSGDNDAIFGGQSPTISMGEVDVRQIAARQLRPESWGEGFPS